MQPGRNSCLAAKIGQVAVGRNKCLLGGITGVVLAAEHTETESENFSLPPSNDFAEGIWIFPYCPFDKLFIRQVCQHLLVLKRLSHENNIKHSRDTVNIRIQVLDAGSGEKVWVYRPKGLLESTIMAAEIKPTVSMEETFDRLDIRVGRVVSVEPATAAAKPSYVIHADFGRFGTRTSVARLTQHDREELIGRQILGVLNFEVREIGGITSEFLCLGVQYPKADSGEATIVTPLIEAKLGSKLF
jgi:tRNA-binding protein